jgi:hypothetical protein
VIWEAKYMAEILVLNTSERLQLEVTKVKRWPQAGEIITVGKRVFTVVNINTIFPESDREPFIQIMVSSDDKK